MSWVAFGKLSGIFRNKQVPVNLKRKSCNQCVLPVLTYAAETYNITDIKKKKNQTAYESMMLNIRLSNRNRNTWIREKSILDDAVEWVARIKWNWAGHVARRDYNRWSKQVIQW